VHKAGYANIKCTGTNSFSVVPHSQYYVLPTGAALAFAERGKPEVLHRPLNLDINSSISEKQVTEMDAGRFLITILSKSRRFHAIQQFTHLLFIMLCKYSKSALLLYL